MIGHAAQVVTAGRISTLLTRHLLRRLAVMERAGVLVTDPSRRAPSEEGREQPREGGAASSPSPSSASAL